MALNNTPARAKSIFISYRRDDSGDEVGRVYDTLNEHFSADALFRDVDDIEPGADFPSVVRKQLQDCDVVLVMIGQEWLSAQQDGQQRLADSSDHLRQEVQIALAHPNAQVIPVLLRRATMPKPEMLPFAMRRLADINALRVRTRDSEYREDMATLIAAIEKARAISEALRQAAAARSLEQDSDSVAGAERIGAEPMNWDLLIRAIEASNVVVVCGSELGTDAARGDPVCREAGIAACVASRLGLAALSSDSHRPLMYLYETCRQAGRQHEFARALKDASDELSPASALKYLISVDPIRMFVTSAHDRALEQALALGGRTASSVAYTIEDPLQLDRIDLDCTPALVYHVAGRATGLDGEAAITDSDWRRFANAWRILRPDSLVGLFEDRDVLFLGSGAPSDFFTFWLELAGQLHCAHVWMGISAVANSNTTRDVLRDDVHCGKSLFDDSPSAGFLEELASRWALAQVTTKPTLVRPTTRSECEESGPTLGVTPERSIVHAQALDSEHPYPGLDPYSETDRAFFFGRAAEVRQIDRALRNQPVTVLFSPSGTGKTSLINAGVLPYLRSSNMIPVVLRVNWMAPGAASMRQQVLCAVREAASAAGIELPQPLDHDLLWTYFHRGEVTSAVVQGGRSRLVLVLDQFEEFFEFAAAAGADSDRFKIAWLELCDLVENRVPQETREAIDKEPGSVANLDVRAPAPSLLISLREDFLPDLLMLGDEMPSLNRRSIRLLGLRLADAREVVLRTGNGLYDEEAASALVERLSESSRNSAASVASLRIDPALLQLTCLQLDRIRLARGLKHVDAALIAEVGGGVFDSYLQDVFGRFDPALRFWVEDELITPEGHRTRIPVQFAEQSLRGRGLNTADLYGLVDSRLLRVSSDREENSIELVDDLIALAIARSRPARIPASAGPISRLLSGLRRTR